MLCHSVYMLKLNKKTVKHRNKHVNGVNVFNGPVFLLYSHLEKFHK